MNVFALQCYAAIAWTSALSQASAWDYPAHRAVNQAALAALPTNFPAFVRAPENAERIAFLSSEPDRWRNTPDLPLKHTNGPEHYMDIEELETYEIKPEQLPVFRYDFIARLALFRAKHPERFSPSAASRDEDHTKNLVGLLPWGMAEGYSKLKSGFSCLKAFEEHGGTPEEITNARANIAYVMGVMGHLFGDAAQPLHTTKHHHGWVGENPKGYGTAHSFHSWIDGGFFGKTGGVDSQDLSEKLRPAGLVQVGNRAAKPDEMFAVAVAFLVEQNKKVEALYNLDKEGKLSGKKSESQAGREFLEGQLLLASQFLADTWFSAWRQAPPDTFLIGQLSKRKKR
jgi:hypothetical protein